MVQAHKNVRICLDLLLPHPRLVQWMSRNVRQCKCNTNTVRVKIMCRWTELSHTLEPVTDFFFFLVSFFFVFCLHSLKG